MALKTSVKELKAKEISKVEEISWNISNRIREFGNASMYGGFCLAYVAYVSLKNKITDINQLKEYVELTFSPERVSFIKENIGNLWNVAIEISEEYDIDQGNRIVNPPYITEKMAMRFFSMFWGREDVYARRGKNGGYFPQCANRWNDRLCPKQRKEKVFCDECENTKWISLDVKK